MTQFLKMVTKENPDEISKSVTGSWLLDDYANAVTYRGRSFEEISISMERIWDEDPKKALQITFYIRTISRIVNYHGVSTETSQYGLGLKDEFRKRMIWLLYNHPSIFYINAWLIPVVGSYKDLWEIMLLDLSLENRMNRKLLFKVMVHDLADESTRELFLKYMPISKSVSKLTTDRSKAINKLAIEFRDFTNLSSKDIRQLKSDSKGNLWQQLVSSNKFSNIFWESVQRGILNALRRNLSSDHSTMNDNNTPPSTKEAMESSLSQEIFTHLKLL